MTKTICPKCNSKNLAKFIYGLPADRELYLKAKKDKKIVGGGCTRRINDPNWKCNDCLHQWNDDKKLQKLLAEIGHTCPQCNKDDVALIFWGYPGNMDNIKKEIEKKEIVLGGCIVTDHDPKWECNRCFHRWGKRDDD